MKVKSKNITLMIATAIFLFAGIFGAVQADENRAKSVIKIKNNLKYDVKVAYTWYYGSSGHRVAPFELLIPAGEEVRKDVSHLDLQVADIEPTEEDQDLEFKITNVLLDEWFPKSRVFKQVEVAVFEKEKEIGSFLATFDLNLNAKTVTGTISSKDKNLQFGEQAASDLKK